MKRLALILLLASSVGASAQVSYWWSVMLRKPDAAQSQAYFFIPGQGIFFTYDTNRVVINASGGAGAGTNYVAGTNIVFTLIGPTTYRVSTTVTNGVNGTNGAPGPPGPPGTNAIVGITTNICVVFCDGSTNSLSFTNGVLVAVAGPPVPPHAASIIQPLGAGYIIQPGGSTLLLP